MLTFGCLKIAEKAKLESFVKMLKVCISYNSLSFFSNKELTSVVSDYDNSLIFLHITEKPSLTSLLDTSSSYSTTYYSSSDYTGTNSNISFTAFCR